MRHRRRSVIKDKKPVNYSDRCTKCGAWFTFSNVADLKRAVRAHMKDHKEKEKEEKRREKEQMKDLRCTKCGKKYYGHKKGLCPSCVGKKRW